jgi:hypothetical protein
MLAVISASRMMVASCWQGLMVTQLRAISGSTVDLVSTNTCNSSFDAMLTLESNTGRRSIKTLGVQNDRVTLSKSKERRKEDALKGMHFEV